MHFIDMQREYMLLKNVDRYFRCLQVACFQIRLLKTAHGGGKKNSHKFPRKFVCLIKDTVPSIWIRLCFISTAVKFMKFYPNSVQMGPKIFVCKISTSTRNKVNIKEERPAHEFNRPKVSSTRTFMFISNGPLD